MNWWHYLLLANLYLALFYGFYLLLLRNETYFMLNRIYLVSAAVLSFFIPMMQAEWVKNLFITQKVQQTIYYIGPGFVYQAAPTESGFTVAQFFTAVYWLVSVLLLARLIYRLFLLKKYMHTEETGNAFSFFGKVKVDENLPQKDVILQHEMVHVAQLHSADVLLFEVLGILNWFNPVIYCYRKAVKHIHEFIADRDAISFGMDKADYALLLLSQCIGIQPNALTNSFFNQSLLKQRIMMLHKNPSRRLALLKYGLSAPLFAAMLILTSATVSEQKAIRTISDKIGSDATVKEVASDFKDEISASAKIISTKKGVVKTAATLKGKVVDASGKLLAGVSVNYTKKQSGSITGKDGNFTISNYEEGDLLTFNLKSKGYKTLIKSFKNITANQSIVVLLSLRSNLIPRPNIDHIKFPKPVIFTDVEMLPNFPGGEVAFSKFLASHIRYPKVAKENGTEGRVIISFVVETNGALTNIKVLRDIGDGCGPEAIRVLKESPKWIPGKQKSKPVRVAYTMPVNFSLDDGTKKTSSGSTTKFRATGIVITGYVSPDSSKNARRLITNGNSLYGNALVIINGVEAKLTDPLKNISPNDIQVITVLKDTNGTAKYGDKGKNGVILITTKKGKKAA